MYGARYGLKVIVLLMDIQLILAPFVEKAIFFSSELPFSRFSIPLICMSVLLQISYCLGYNSHIVNLEIK